MRRSVSALLAGALSAVLLLGFLGEGAAHASPVATRRAHAVRVHAHAGAASAQATTIRDAWPLHAGSIGPRVAGLQWLLAGNCPNKFSVHCGGKVRPTLRRYTRGVFGARTASALIAFRYRLGFPAKGQCGARASKLVPSAGPWFFALLEARRDAHGVLLATRPACWVALAQSRIHLIETGVTAVAARIRAFELSQIGVHETCGGSCNRGTLRNGDSPAGLSVDTYERHFGLLGQAWCVIFQQYAFWVGGYRPSPFGAPWPASFGVIAQYRWAAAHNELAAKARVGSLVAFLNDAGHAGFVIAVSASGYTTIEGNTSDGVHLRSYLWGERLRVFINEPGVA